MTEQAALRHWAHNDPARAAAGPFGVEIEGVGRPGCVAQGIWRHYPIASP